jgi:hypothetical protein
MFKIETKPRWGGARPRSGPKAAIYRLVPTPPPAARW